MRELTHRRALLTALFASLASRDAWAGGTPAPIDEWRREITGLRDALTAGDINQAAWIDGIERANERVPIAELVAYLDLDWMAQRLPARLSSVADAAPAYTNGNAFVRVFGMRRGAGLLPHVHNGMVSAHLVVAGAFHVRTHNRVRDLDNAVVLRPSQDRTIGVGATLMMSDDVDNHHWLVACEDRSFTLDVAVFHLPPGERTRLPSTFENTILIDPTARPERDGTLIAPVLSVEAAVAKFGRSN